VALASSAGFAAQGRVAHGKTWRTICDVAGEIDAVAIVLGARGLSRMGSLLLGSVSFAVTVHAKRPRARDATSWWWLRGTRIETFTARRACFRRPSVTSWDPTVAGGAGGS
jgi:hypothetical protein